MKIFLAAALLFAGPSLQAQSALPWQSAGPATTIGGHRLQLRAIPWRDFMPSPVRREGSDLMVNLLLTTPGSLPFPVELRVDSAWVRSGERIWAAAPTNEPRPDLPNGLDLMLRGGPRWDPGSPIDVLVRVRLPSGAVGYLQVKQVPIGRVS